VASVEKYTKIQLDKPSGWWGV